MQTFHALIFLAILALSSAAVKLSTVIQTVIDGIKDQVDGSILTTKSDAFLSADEIIRKYGYPVEIHDYSTPDGYILRAFRIPHGKDGKNPGKGQREPVIIVHPFDGSSVDYLCMGSNGTLPFMYADAGFDVWLGNMRGSKYSLKNKKYNAGDVRFWNFTVNEQVDYDVPSSIDYILKVTGKKKLLWYGFSLGAGNILATLSVKPEYNEKIRRIIAVAPAAYVGELQSPFFRAGTYLNDRETIKFFDTFFKGALVTDNPIQPLAPFICATNPTLCYLVILFAGELNPGQIRKKTLVTLSGQFPDLTSIRAYVNILQRVRKKSFSAYDYGESGNRVAYGTPFPLEYNVSRTSVPVCGLYGPGDIAVPSVDALKTFSFLPRWCNPDNAAIDNPRWTHIDNLFAKDAARLVYSRAIAFSLQRGSNCSC